MDRAFLAWFQAASEDNRRTQVPRDTADDRFVGLDWQPGTRWRDAMTDAEIASAERRFGLTFPPD